MSLCRHSENDPGWGNETDESPGQNGEDGLSEPRAELDQMLLERHHVRVRLRLLRAAPEGAEGIQIAEGRQEPRRPGTDTGHCILIPCRLGRHTDRLALVLLDVISGVADRDDFLGIFIRYLEAE